MCVPRTLNVRATLLTHVEVHDAVLTPGPLLSRIMNYFGKWLSRKLVPLCPPNYSSKLPKCSSHHSILNTEYYYYKKKVFAKFDSENSVIGENGSPVMFCAHLP